MRPRAVALVPEIRWPTITSEGELDYPSGAPPESAGRGKGTERRAVVDADIGLVFAHLDHHLVWFASLERSPFRSTELLHADRDTLVVDGTPLGFPVSREAGEDHLLRNCVRIRFAVNERY